MSQQAGGPSAQAIPPILAQRTHLWIASRGSDIGPSPLPAGWIMEVDACFHSYTTFWQYADSGPYPAGDQDLFNGDEAGLSK